MARVLIYREKFSEIDLPDSTRLRLVNKTNVFNGVIREGVIYVEGVRGAFSSPSAAAYGCTGTSLNGWAYWCVKRPGEICWTPLSWLRVGLTADSD